MQLTRGVKLGPVRSAPIVAQAASRGICKRSSFHKNHLRHHPVVFQKNYWQGFHRSCFTSTCPGLLSRFL
ncbi:MAG: hypothetical protein BJ554DRAFT_4999 [Olpidium bornovanus]|uniref:Uncharacterized protein n=1 Tax=Olpidium bornovanus TaxID=278681 RepID=A0A8H7ZM11_9FUNG|nr:MAG: hypothetical protein BJ554DRAFT_4999 [Olpidium bornovanus]